MQTTVLKEKDVAIIGTVSIAGDWAPGGTGRERGGEGGSSTAKPSSNELGGGGKGKKDIWVKKGRGKTKVARWNGVAIVGINCKPKS